MESALIVALIELILKYGPGAAISASNATAGAFESAVVGQGIYGNAIQQAVSAENFAVFINV